MALIIENKRMRQKVNTLTGFIPAIGPSDDHTDGSWTTADVYSGEFVVDEFSKYIYVGLSDYVAQIAVFDDSFNIKTKSATLTGSYNAIFGLNNTNSVVNNSMIIGESNVNNSTLVDTPNYGSFIYGKSNLNRAYSSMVGGENNINDGSRSLVVGNLNINSGYTSIIYGSGNYNSVRSSLVGGLECINNGSFSLVSGIENTNSGYTSIVCGSRCINSMGGSLVSGYECINSGYFSLVSGYDCINSGDHGTVCGSGCINSGDDSLVSGLDNINSGYSSIVCGSGCINSGYCSLVSGLENTNSGDRSVVGGENNINNATRSLVVGHVNINSGSTSIVYGQGNYNSKLSSLVGGTGCINSGDYSLVSGYANYNYEGSSLVSGYANANYGSYSLVSGRFNTNSGDCSAIIGGYEITNTDSKVTVVPTLKLADTSTINASEGTIRFNGTDMLGYVNGAWLSLISGGANVYGELTNTATTTLTLTTDGVYYPIVSGCESGSTNNTSINEPSGGSGYTIQVDSDGLYKIQMACSLSTDSVTAIVIHASLYVNGVHNSTEKLEFESTMIEDSTINVSFVGLLDLNVDDYIETRFKVIGSSSKNISLLHYNLLVDYQGLIM